MRRLIQNLSQQEQLNFLITNRIPRQLITQAAGWFSKIESKPLTSLSIGMWRLFADDLDLSEAKKSRFKSLHDCFTREIKEGSRSVDMREDIVSSPCDAIVGSCGRIEGTRVFQAKGFPYELGDLIPDPQLQGKYRDGVYVTLRLKSSMYHRFHAPMHGQVRKVTYISGDTWNVNPVALKRIEKLYCKNERAVIEFHAGPDNSITLVPVAAILVASIKLHCLDDNLDMKYRGPNDIACNSRYRKGDEMGYFQHGSTIILFAPSRYSLCQGITTGKRIAMGDALLRDTHS